MHRYLLALLMLFWLSAPLTAQKKILDHDVYGLWKKIDAQIISADGQWVACTAIPQTEGDSEVQLWHATDRSSMTFVRASEARFSDDSEYLFFKLKPALDSIKLLRRKKVKDDDLPKDSIVIFHLKTAEKTVIPSVRGFTVPDKWSGWLFYTPEPEKPAADKKDTVAVIQDTATLKMPLPKDTLVAAKTEKVAGKNGKKPKKEGKDNGYKLVVRELSTAIQDTFYYVHHYAIAEKGPRVVFQTTGRDSAFSAGVYTLSLPDRKLKPLHRSKGKFRQLSLDQEGKQVAFLADTDTSKVRIRPWQLLYWPTGSDSAQVLAAPGAAFLPENWGLSEFANLVFSKNGGKLYFGMAPPPLLNDTTLLPEEIVQVEVWAYTDPVLYTAQKARLESDRNKSYTAVCHLNNRKIIPLGSPEAPELRFIETRSIDLAVGFNDDLYAMRQSWEGGASRDAWLIDEKTGARQKIAANLRGHPRLSPGGRYVSWYNETDTAWYAYGIADRQVRRLTDNRQVAFFNEEFDMPDAPDAYGSAAWMQDDEALLLYDKFDIWSMDPAGKKAPKRLTEGRETETAYRYVRLDPEKYALYPDDRILLHQFSEKTKNEGYAWLDIKTGRLTHIMGGPYAYSRSPRKARRSADMIFTLENFQTFPDLQYFRQSGIDLKGRDLPRTLIDRITDLNPRQKEYNWGTIELVSWASLDGKPLQGLLVKPENFDPAKKYPLIVQYYERSTDQLHAHRPPDAGRSQINYSFYASRGYVIFNPDIPYREGYPGESAYNAIMPGVTSLIEKGIVDPSRIGIQGHSWGGYQTAYLLTKTRMFACAEAGAAVVNMVSAYGGVRWESGVSRMFQYERQQSRIGGTLWQYPMRFLENSPLFALDKITTPVLLIHNDKDGAVPWYQGIEFFTAMRRLGKPCWLLNYNEEPHWPVKLQNRIDFQKRMQQFLDHYLMGAPRPLWMEKGVPAVEKGIRLGY